MSFKKWLPIVFITLPGLTQAAPLPADLVKVTGEIQQKCIEYYTYQGTLYCSTKVLNKAPLDPHIHEYETQNINFDHRVWQAAWGKKDAHSTTVEYVPMGDDINQWHELITSQYFSPILDNLTPKVYSQKAMERLQEAGYKPILTYHQEKDNQVIFEFRITEPENQAQDELQMVTVHNHAFYVLHYVIKKADMGEANRNKWLTNLKKSTIK